MLNFKDLYTIKIENITHICNIVFYDKTNDTYTISLRGNGILTGIKEDELTDISFSRPTPVVENGIIKNTFEELSLISKSRDYSGLSIGDKLPITLNGTIGTLNFSNENIYVYILDFDHNAEVEGYGITFAFGFLSGDYTEEELNRIRAFRDGHYAQSNNTGEKWFNYNHWGGVTYGGWKSCDIRYDVLGSTDVAPKNYGAAKDFTSEGYDATSSCATNPVPNTLMSCLSEDLRRVMKPITKWTDNTLNPNQGRTVSSSIDYLPIPSQYEMFGGTYSANPDEELYQKPYLELSSSTDNRIKYPIPGVSATANYYRLRSVNVGGVNNVTGVNPSGGTFNVMSSSYAYCIAPIFLI